jgi:sugar phosphate permease
MDPRYMDESRNQLFYLMTIEAIIIVAISLPCFFLMRDKPETPPR